MSVCLCNARIAPILASIYPQPAPPLPPVSVVSPIVSLTRNIYRSHGHLVQGVHKIPLLYPPFIWFFAHFQTPWWWIGVKALTFLKFINCLNSGGQTGQMSSNSVKDKSLSWGGRGGETKYL